MMNISKACPQCGGTFYHFSQRKNKLICDTCGTVIQTEDERNADINYERNIALARQHLQVGNWEEAKRLIQPFCSSRPTDKQLYLMLLMAVTKGYTDYLVDNEAIRREAFEYWDKLVRLRCVNETMKRYARRRLQQINEEKCTMYTKIGIAVGVCILISLIAVCSLGAVSKEGFFVMLLAGVSWFYTVKFLKKISREAINIRSNNQRNDNNPFS